jgi:hypothetical protein
MPRKHPPTIQATETVRYCEKWSTNILWPAPIDERVKALVKLAVKAGEPDSLTRSELIAALVLMAPADGDALLDMLRRYRKATVRDAIVAEDGKPAKLIVLSERKPGRQ